MKKLTVKGNNARVVNTTKKVHKLIEKSVADLPPDVRFLISGRIVNLVLANFYYGKRGNEKP